MCVPIMEPQKAYKQHYLLSANIVKSISVNLQLRKNCLYDLFVHGLVQVLLSIILRCAAKIYRIEHNTIPIIGNKRLRSLMLSTRTFNLVFANKFTLYANL